MTKEYKQYLFVEVNRGAKQFELIGCISGHSTQMLFYNDFYGHDGTCEKVLPPGSYSIVGLANELTEEQWEPIVDTILYFNSVDGEFQTIAYMDYIKPTSWDIKTRKESGYSLLRHLGLGKQVLIIKKEL